MAQDYFEIIETLGQDRVKKNEPMSLHTTFRVGGPADLFFEAKTTSDLVDVIKLCQQEKVSYFVLGGGSNLLVNDSGFRGMVIKVQSSKFKVQSSRVTADAGMSLGDLVKKTAQLGLSGLEFAAGIPGTVGGAIRGNAGAWQQSIGDKVIRVKILSQLGKIKWLEAKDCQFSYRQSRFKIKPEIILGVELRLDKGDKEEIAREIEENREKKSSQPAKPSAGCIFVNPKDCPAGQLIEQCGLKGKKIGDAQISPKHANFIVNLGKAKAGDVNTLIELAKEMVFQKFGIHLKEEIYLLGSGKI